MKRFALPLLIGLLCAGGVLLLGLTPFVKRTELLTVDYRYRAREPIEFRSDLGFIDFDDSSIALYGRWPWPRHRHVALVRTLDLYDAAAAGYDVFFFEANDIIFDGTEFRDYDAEFANAMARGGNIILAEVMQHPDAAIAAGKLPAILRQTDSIKDSATPEKLRALEIAARYTIPIDSATEEGLFKTVDVATVIPVLADAAAGVGYAQVIPGIDPVVRLYPTLMYYDRAAWPSIALVMVAHLLDFPVSEIKIIPGSHIALPNGVNIPIDVHGQMITNWAGGYMDRGLHISFSELSSMYALNRAKELSREFAPSPENYSAILERIRSVMDRDLLVGAEESERIARRIAFARVAQPLLANAGELAPLAALEPDASIRTEVLAAIATALDIPGSVIDESWAGEIRKNVAFFKAREKLGEAEPLYFSPPIQVPWDGATKSFSPTDLEGKTFMIGLTGTGTIDINPMPFEEAFPMVGFHLHAINTILTNQFLHFPKTWMRYAGAFGLALCAAALAAAFTPLRAFVGCIALALGWSIFVWRSWTASGEWVPWVEPLLALSTTYIAIVISEFVRAARERRVVRELFATMVSPSVLKLMEENPDRFSLSGERKEATIFFSSIEGFAKVTQGVAPDELTSILGNYLTPTSDIIMEYDGYIDKYEGHIIMADFGVPLDDPDHARKCCWAAIEQQQDIAAFRVFVAARYGEDVTVSMGINSGWVSAGNMGSERKMQYTVMGDAVNVAARFRPANGIYGTGIITGEAAEPMIRETVELRLLDKLLLKGKTTPTTMYEILGWKSGAYEKFYEGRPLPPSLFTRWRDCPPEKVFGYIQFWREREKTFGEPLCGEIAAFFEEQIPAVERMMIAGAVLAMRALDAEIERLEKVANIASGQEREGGIAMRRERLAAVSAHPDLKMQAQSLDGKFQKLEASLAKTSRVGIESVNRALDAIRSWFAGDVPPDPEKTFEDSQKEYQSAVQIFFNSLARRANNYHAAMAKIGSVSGAAANVRALYEEALKLHWDRKWDEALEKLRNAGAIDAGDGPTKALIERIEGYKMAAPDPNWQGEFVQTKK